jgi:hypothetical protein
MATLKTVPRPRGYMLQIANRPILRRFCIKSATSLLGSVALILASNAAVEAALLVAGPVTINGGSDLITCSAINTTTVGGSHIDIAIDFVDATGAGIFSGVGMDVGRVCFGVGNDTTCTFTHPASAIGTGKSPFTCYFTPLATLPGETDHTHPIAGSICSKSFVGQAQPEKCLQAVPRE